MEPKIRGPQIQTAQSITNQPNTHRQHDKKWEGEHKNHIHTEKE